MIGPERRGRYLALLAVLVLGLGGLWAARIALGSLLAERWPEQADGTPVVAAAVDIPVGTVLTAEMLSVRGLSGETDGHRATLLVEGLVGKVAVERIAAGEQVRASQVRALEPSPEVTPTRVTDVIPPGKRAVAVRFVEALDKGGPVRPGDLVEVVAVFPKETTGLESDVSVCVLAGVPVLGVAEDPAADLLGGQPRGTPADATAAASEASGTAAAGDTRQARGQPVSRRRIATLVVTLQEAQLLALAQENGELYLLPEPVAPEKTTR